MTSRDAVAPAFDSDAFRYALARQFSILLWQLLDEHEMRLVVTANRAETDLGVCHSHDRCDANMVMAQAWKWIAKCEMDANDDAQARAWSAAWSLAVKAEFCAPALIPGARYRGVWGADEFVSDQSAEHAGSFFTPEHGYDGKDMADIAALDVGQTWTSGLYVTHSLTRVA